jgi:hypothetical protein
MRFGLAGFAVLFLGGCVGATTTFGLLEREVGRSIADVTLVTGPPDRSYDLPDGRRAFVFNLPPLVPTSPQRCPYTVYAELEGRPQSLAAWRVVEIVPAPPGCEDPAGVI